MTLPLYLAMTGAEIQQTASLPEKLVWMACHFSPYSTGLSNFPVELPTGSIIMVNDRTPPCGHDPLLIAAQLQQLAEDHRAEGILLDFQRPDDPQTTQIVNAITEVVTCPVGVSESYAKTLSCPVFLNPVPLHIPLAEHIAPWKERELWLDASTECEQIDVTADGSRFSVLFPPGSEKDGFYEPKLHCRYKIKNSDSSVRFTLWRTEDCLHALLQEAESAGISKAFGLYQQLGNKNPAD